MLCFKKKDADFTCDRASINSHYHRGCSYEIYISKYIFCTLTYSIGYTICYIIFKYYYNNYILNKITENAGYDILICVAFF